MANADKIQDIAEERIRKGGFGAFSFREIADEIGIKSSSVHYHFRTKADLAQAVARRYSDRFMEALGDSGDEGALERYIESFRRALEVDRRMCLCGALAAEADMLPEEVRDEARRFFQLQINWLKNMLMVRKPGWSQDEAKERAITLIASLEGAMLVSQAMSDDRCFEAVIRQLEAAA